MSCKRNYTQGCLLLLTRLRLKHNGLSANLHRLNLKESPQCSCGLAEENEMHFFLKCPLYDNKRNVYMEKLDHILFPILNNHAVDLVRGHANRLLNIILFGSNELTIEANTSLFMETCRYITATGRFTVFQ